MKTSIGPIDKTKTAFLVIIAVVSILAFPAALIAGVGLLTALVTAILVAIVIYFGSIQELAASVVVGFLLKAFTTSIHDFVGIWWTGNTADRFFGLVASTGYLKLIVVVFFFAYTLSFFTSRIQIFTIRLGGSIKSDGKEKKDE